MTDATYEIRVAGLVPDEALSELDDIEVRVEGPRTVLSGPVADESALFGLLARVRALGLELMEVRRIPPDEAGAPL
jgi:hypothetical protein